MTRAATRRDLFGGASSLLLLTAAAAGQAKAEELDGELLRLCTDFIDRDTRRRALDAKIDDMPHSPDREALQIEADALSENFHERMAEIAELPARTPEGLRSKALLVAQYWAGDPPPDGEIAWSLMCDILGRAYA